MSESSQSGYVYILTNPSFKDNWIKIGKTIDIDQRLRQLDNTSTPLPFEVYATLKTSKYNEVEKQLHMIIDLLTDYRIRQNREYFNISPERALNLLKDISITLDDAVLDIKDDSVVFVPAKTASPLHHDLDDDEVRAISASNWIFSGSPKYFDHEGCIKKFGGIYWKTRGKLKEGDIVYMYRSGKDARIQYKFRVAQANLAYSEKMDRQDEFCLNDCIPLRAALDKVTPCYYFEFISADTSGALTREALKEHGLNGNIQGHRTLTGELLDFVEKNFK